MSKIAVLGVVFSGFGALLPWLVFKANRLLAGSAVGFSAWVFLVPWLVVTALIAFSKFKTRGWGLFVLGSFGFGFFLFLLSSTSQALGVSPISRVSPAIGFWMLLLGTWLVAYAGALEVQRIWLAGIGAVVTTVMLLLGFFDALSVIREYNANQSEFWLEMLQHILLAFWAWVLSSLLGTTLGSFAASRPIVSGWLLGITNVLYTLPSIALFALLIPFFSAVVRAIPLLEQLGVRGIGNAPALTALTIYGLLPVLRGTILGLLSVPQEPLEAAKGLGFKPNQVFWRVRVPLAIPLLLEGLRLAAVSLIGLAALSSLIGAGGLGTFIFTGLGNGAIDRVLLGAIPTLILAVLVNSVLRGLEFQITPRGIR